MNRLKIKLNTRYILLFSKDTKHLIIINLYVVLLCRSKVGQCVLFAKLVAVSMIFMSFSRIYLSGNSDEFNIKMNAKEKLSDAIRSKSNCTEEFLE